MAERVHLKNAPITEAVLDIHVRLREGFGLGNLQPLQARVIESYPIKKERRQFTQTLQMREGKSAGETTQLVDGFMFCTADEKQVFQARMDGFSFNRLKPYKTWEALRDEARMLWGLYEEVASPEIQRIGLRYINRMDLPMPVRDFKDYLTAGPPVPEGLPQGVSSFFTRVVIAEPKIQATAIITQVFEQIVDPNFLPVYLDIDVSKQLEPAEVGKVWEFFETLREFKDRIFFSSITESAKELFQ
jgi:uncharacterized protein (TIGR04255 family)